MSLCRSFLLIGILGFDPSSPSDLIGAKKIFDLFGLEKAKNQVVGFAKIEYCRRKNRSITALCAEGGALGALFVDGMIGPAAADLDRIQRAAGLPGTVIGTFVDGTADIVISMILIHRLHPPKG